MSPRGRSPSVSLRHSTNNEEDMDVDKNVLLPEESPMGAKSDKKVVIVTNLTRNVVESHLQTVFGFYGQIVKVDLPIFGKSGQNRGKAALEFVDSRSAHKAVSHMDGGQLDGTALRVELSDLPIRARSRSPRRGIASSFPAKNGRDKDRFEHRSYSRSRSLSRSRTPSRSPIASRPYRRSRERDTYTGRDTYRGRSYGRRGQVRSTYRPPRDSRSRSRSRSPPRRSRDRLGPRRRSPSYSRGGHGRLRDKSRSRSYSVRSSRSGSRSYSRSRSRSHTRSLSYSSYSRYSRSRSRSVSRGRRSHSREDIRDSRSRSPRDL